MGNTAPGAVYFSISHLRVRSLAAAAAMAAALGAGAAGGAHAQSLDQACRDAEQVPGTCIGISKLAERASAECRRAGRGDDESCVLPMSRRVIRNDVKRHESSWLHDTLAFQYELANTVPFRDTPWIGTHNSFNSTSEEPTLSHTDSNQQLSLTDQLRIGVRSLELDVHWTQSSRAGGAPAPVVCHGRGRSEMHLGCTSERLLGDVLDEIATWLRAHSDQVVLLYVEDNVDTSEGYAPTARLLDERLRAKDGRSLIYKPPPGGACADLPLSATRADVLARRAQVVIVSGCGEGSAWRGLVFDWNDVEVESRPHGYRDHPTCDQDPDGDGKPQFGRDVYAAKLVRYFEDSTWVSPTASLVGLGSTDDGLTPETVERMARCGVDLLGLDQLLPRDGRLDALAWSWAPTEPSRAGDCTVQRGDGRWYARRCEERHAAACALPNRRWLVIPAAVPAASARGLCSREGATTALPRTAAENQALRDAARAAGASGIWLRG